MNKLFALDTRKTFMDRQYSGWYTKWNITDKNHPDVYLNISDMLLYTSDFIDQAYFRIPKKYSEILDSVSLNRINSKLTQVQNIELGFLVFGDGMVVSIVKNEVVYLDVRILIYSSSNDQIKIRILMEDKELGARAVYQSMEKFLEDLREFRKNVISALITCVRQEITNDKNCNIDRGNNYYTKGITAHRNLLHDSRDNDTKNRYCYSIEDRFWDSCLSNYMSNAFSSK